MSNPKLFLVLVILVTFTFLRSEAWKYEADVSFNMNQNYYSNNWAGEEMASISWAANANLLAEKQLSTKLHNKNTLKLAFGQTHSQYIDPENDKKWDSPDKTTDLIDLESILRFTLGSFVDPFISGRIESQFLDKRVPDDTKMLNPNTITESFGVSRIFFKTETSELSSRLGAALKQYLDARVDETPNDGGIEFITEYKTPLGADNITFNSKLNVYNALYYSESEDLEGTDYEDDWKAPRVNWENIISANITKLISLNLYLQAIYDETYLDADGKSIDELQFKQTLSLGISYKLM